MEKPILAAILSCSSTRLTDEEKYLFSSSNPLGVSLFSRNIKSVTQLKTLIKEIKETVARDDILICIDEEGGRVSRLKAISGKRYVSAKLLGSHDTKYSQMHAELIASDMKQYGINVNYAPVVDKPVSPIGKFLEGRCFTLDEEKITQYAKIMADSYIEMSVCPCIKHIPGHFATISDPHLKTPIIDYPVENIKNTTKYLRNFNNYPMWMTAHVVLKSIDETSPVTVSKKCISELIREYLEYDGLLVSDAIDMQALKGDILQKAKNCWNAGIDVVCYCSGKNEDMQQICQEPRFMTEKTLIRFDKIKKIIHNIPKDVNITAIRKCYNKAFEDKQDMTYTYDATEILYHMHKKGESK